MVGGSSSDKKNKKMFVTRSWTSFDHSSGDSQVIRENTHTTLLDFSKNN